MQQLIQEAYATQNWQLISQIFHNKAELLQVQYAVGIDDFRLFVSAFQLVRVVHHQGLELVTGQLYYFLTGGFFAKKVEKNKESKNKKNNRKAISSNDVRSPRNFTTPIPKEYLSSIQDFLTYSEPKSTGYYYSSQNQNIVLKLKYSRLQQNIAQKLHSYYATKLKFLSRLPIFKQVPKNIIQDNLEKFLFTKIGFNDLIYGQNLRPSSVFVLMKGEVIVEGANKSPGFIVNPPQILGDSKCCVSEQARCLTYIEKPELENIFKRKAMMDHKQFEGTSTTSSIGLLRARYFRQFQMMSEKNSSQLAELRLTNAQDSLFVPKVVSKFQPVPNYRSKRITNFTCNTQKKERIKQHFSSFLSDKFKQYSTKLQKEKNFDECKETPILYQLKPLCQSSPNYQQMQARLKKQRIKKILEVKQNLQRSNSSKSLLRTSENGGSCRDSFRIEKDCIDAKIERILNYKISKQINKRYGYKTKLSKLKMLV